ncbi:MAG: RidA family protein [Pirellulales bacterium]|nr:RidA family protein [Pirellulales bacterium]
MSHESRLKELNLVLPDRPRPLGVYHPVLVVDGLAYVSGHGPINAEGVATCGRLGDSLDKQAGYEAARLTGLNMLTSLRQHFGSLDAIARLVKTTGFVCASPDFKDHPAVINGFSELMRDVFGQELGLGARSAVGVPSLPAGWAVEIEAVFKIA